MNFKPSIAGSTSLYLFVGYFTTLWAVILLGSTKTPFYLEIIKVIQKSPIISFLASLPGIFILGVFINMIKFCIRNRLLKIPIYRFDKVPKPVMNELELFMDEELQLNPDHSLDYKFTMMRKLHLPTFDENDIQSRWLSNLIENIITISFYSAIVVICRSIAFKPGSFDWFFLTANILLSLILFIPIKDLQISYTLSEIGLVLREHESNGFDFLRQKSKIESSNGPSSDLLGEY